MCRSVHRRGAARSAPGATAGPSEYSRTRTSPAFRRPQDAEEFGESLQYPAKSPEENLRAALRRVANAEFLTTQYLSLRLQLWALAQAHPDFGDINTAAQKRYRAAIAALIRAARPDLSRAESIRRAADIDVVQNGMWLTALLGLDRAAIRRSVARCEDLAFE